MILGKNKTTVNLISLLEDGNQEANVDLRDGDDIFIPSKKYALDQLIEINKSNLTPDKLWFTSMVTLSKGRIPLQQGIFGRSYSSSRGLFQCQVMLSLLDLIIMVRVKKEY